MASTLQNLLKNKAEKDKVLKSLDVDSSDNHYQLLPTTTNHSQAAVTSTNPYQKQPNNQNIDSISVKEISLTQKKAPTSPSKNFTKVPNSITTEAIPQGWFKGLSKHTYDVLYKLTRGAINPVREIQLTRFELMKLTGLSENTQRAHIKYLSAAGLIKNTYQTGKHEGAIYEVFVLEEINSGNSPHQPLPTTTNHYQPLPTDSNHYQKLGLDTSQKLGVVSTTKTLIDIDDEGGAKTSLKTLKNDDEAFADFKEKLQAVAEELTGRPIRENDRTALSEIADLLILELRVAASRTRSVSSAPAFLAEVLRRRLSDARRSGGGNAEKSKGNSRQSQPDVVGKPAENDYALKPLDRQGRANALEELREFANEDFLHDFRKWYLDEDWHWLMQQLGKSDADA